MITPTTSRYDEDGNGLLDLRVEWADSSGAVDFNRVELRPLSAGIPTPIDSNLLRSWRVLQRDQQGLIAEEPSPGVLPSGIVRLELVVSDMDGNISHDTIQAFLPEAVLIKTIASGQVTGLHPAQGMALCPDDSLLYVTVGPSLWIVDPYQLRSESLVTRPNNFIDLIKPLCIPGDPDLYITEARIQRFNRTSRTWDPKMTNTFGAVGIAWSRVNPDLIYEGEYDGILGFISRSGAPRTKMLPTASIDYVPSDIVTTAGDAKLYMTYRQVGGIKVIDPFQRLLLKTIRVSVPSWSNDGDANDLELTRDDARLYATVVNGGSALLEIDTQTDSIIRRLSLPNALAMSLALSPDERRIFVSVMDGGGESQNVLVDRATLQVLRYFPRPRPVGEGRFDEAVMFRPDGKYIFALHNTSIDVYLYRQ